MDLPKAGIAVFALGICILYPIVKGWEEIHSLTRTALSSWKAEGPHFLVICTSIFPFYWAWRERKLVSVTERCRDLLPCMCTEMTPWPKEKAQLNGLDWLCIQPSVRWLGRREDRACVASPASL